MKYRLLAGGSVLVLTAALSACSTPSDSASGDGRTTVDVWLMRDSVSDTFQKEFTADFEKRHPKIDVKIQIQEWDGIGQKITAALASNDAPDVIEAGNTQVAQFAESGGLLDLSDRTDELNGEDWLSGLAEPGAYEGKQYGIPYYAANRVVIHRTDLFEKAGIDAQAIKTREQWIDATAKLNKGGTQGIYLPGQLWYALAGFIWDEGGDLATESGGKWSGALDTPEALRGMAFYEELQALGKGPKDSDEDDPPQAEVMAQGQVAQVISTPGGANVIVEKNPELKGKLAFFPIPGKTAGTPGSVFTGGSDLVVPAAAAHPEEAVTFIKELTGDEWQKKLAVAMSYVPNRTSLASAVAGDPGAAAMAVGAAEGHATPNTPGWAAVEAENPIKDYMTAVLTGGDPAKEAAKASQDITRAMNAGS
ncbi:extracellular solute-binding protein [Streptomyces microflavus]|uniref:Extracellular solute-binding protein n=1 Tax=Streptomyces microflavus TaxID=1919 RepID=A0A6N9V6B5_STRMI|nr:MULTISPECIES: extracellular solute-binding protein [Streptomyces]MBK5996784.1 extracellular solute-binding protein [Streptomyces sp. MBT58]MBW3362056.1 extracellular solute-binding protein [Streptomyces sp. 09ZI22]MEE1731384.1 extracellular solute-binding protein [Streptomyces sp. BE282]NEB68434.1 extracellular solute-binding protein [Streptomyces microflavus]WTF72683.1 extracellular solute-binding protein [Streptomyces microflavus]